MYFMKKVVKEWPMTQHTFLFMQFCLLPDDRNMF